MRQKAFYTHPSLFQPQGISWYRKFIIQRRRLRTDAPFMWVNTPFRIFSFFYQHQPVIKREFTGKGVLAEVFRISSVQCGNKFRHKFQLLIPLLLQSRLNYVGKQIQCPLDFFFGLSCSICVNLSASASFLFGVLLPWQVSHLTDRIFCGFLKADDNLRVAVDIASES